MKELELVSWRTILDETENPKVTKFLNSAGENVLPEVIEFIKEAHEGNAKEINLMIHPDAKVMAIIKKDEYMEVMHHCLMWYEKKELYEMCAEILKDIDNMAEKV